MNKFRLIINLLVPTALGILIFISRNQIGDALTSIKDLPLLIVALQFPIQLLSYLAVAHFYHSYFYAVGLAERLKLMETYKISLELNLINSIFPSGGLSGFSYLGLRLQPLGIPFSASTFAQGLRFFLTFLTFIPLLGIGLLMLTFNHWLGFTANTQIDNWVILIGGGVLLAIVVSLMVGWFVISSQGRIRSLIILLPKAINFISRRLSIRREIIKMSKVEKLLVEIHIDYRKINDNPERLIKPTFWSLLINVFEIATIYVVFIAFGVFLNPGVLIVAYALANFAGLVAVLPGGIGAYEPLMIAILIACGIDQDVAIAGTLVYRIINMLAFIPLGFFFYWMVGKNQIVGQLTKS